MSQSTREMVLRALPFDELHAVRSTRVTALNRWIGQAGNGNVTEHLITAVTTELRHLKDIDLEMERRHTEGEE